MSDHTKKNNYYPEDLSILRSEYVKLLNLPSMNTKGVPSDHFTKKVVYSSLLLTGLSIGTLLGVKKIQSSRWWHNMRYKRLKWYQPFTQKNLNTMFIQWLGSNYANKSVNPLLSLQEILEQFNPSHHGMIINYWNSMLKKKGISLVVH
jgi:hypothetical protein